MAHSGRREDVRDGVDAGTYADYQERRYLPELDGLRAVSILLVFTTHIDALFWEGLHGSVGVTVFFVLSGYLITTLALREERRHGRVDLVAFYVRRVFRIYPLYVVVLLTYCVLVLGVGMASERRDAFVETLPYYVAFLPERALLVDGAEPPFAGAWSLGIEEKFYFVWPVLGFVVLASMRWGRYVAVALTVVLCSTARLWWGPVGVLVEPYALIAGGCLLALVLEQERGFAVMRSLSRRPVPLLLGLGLLLALPWTGAITLGGDLYVVFGVPVAALIVSVVTGPSVVRTCLHHPAMVFLGRVSYAFYLSHNFAINAVQGVLPAGDVWAGLVAPPVALAGAVLLAWVLHRAVEVPMIRWGRALTARRDAEPPRTPAI